MVSKSNQNHKKELNNHGYKLSRHEMHLGIVVYLLCFAFLVLMSLTVLNGPALLAWFLLYSIIIFITYEAFDTLKKIIHSQNVKNNVVWLAVILGLPLFGAFAYWVNQQSN